MFKRNNLSNELKTQAIGLGLCEQWTKAWGNPNKQELINKFLHGIDFCLKHDYPTNEFIKKNFEKEILHRNNIFVDEDVQKRNARQIVVLQGKCTGTLLYDGMTSADVYVRHDSEVTIDCNRLSKVFISVYDRAKVNVIQRDGASVYVYLHGGDCEVKAEGDVMTRRSAE
jgi:hypothetical protein